MTVLAQVFHLRTKVCKHCGHDLTKPAIVKTEQIRDYRSANELSRASLATMFGVSSKTIVNGDG